MYAVYNGAEESVHELINSGANLEEINEVNNITCL